MRKIGIVFALALLLTACAGAGGLKPSIFSTPPSYLSSFPLNTVTESEMILKAGPPSRTTEINGNKALVYQMGEGFGERTWTYIIENGVIIDVVYNDHGSANGSTATQYQSKAN